MNAKDAAKEYADKLYEPSDRGILYQETQNDFIAGAEWQKQKAIEAFNEAMIYFESPDCPTAEDALKHFIACLDQEPDSSCSEKPNN